MCTNLHRHDRRIHHPYIRCVIHLQLCVHHPCVTKYYQSEFSRRSHKPNSQRREKHTAKTAAHHSSGTHWMCDGDIIILYPRFPCCICPALGVIGYFVAWNLFTFRQMAAYITQGQVSNMWRGGEGKTYLSGRVVRILRERRAVATCMSISMSAAKKLTLTVG